MPGTVQQLPVRLEAGDTIVAVATAPGSSARAVIRISGAQAIAMADAHFHCAGGASLAAAPSHSVHVGQVRPGAIGAAPASAYMFRRPRSFTRENVVELHLPGSPGLLALVMDALLAAGARPAEAGEFTARAVRGGGLDVTRAEGIAEAIYARSDGQLRAARRLMQGELSRAAQAARETLDELRGLVEASLDFAEEAIEFISRRELIERLGATAAALRRAAGSRERAERLAEPPRIVLAGPPNAGKSTLLNRLTGLDRSICSPLAGTTRDVIAAPLRLAHGDALLCDTAGLMPLSDDADGVARGADAAARRAAADAALVLWVCAADAVMRLPPELLQRGRGVIRALNKSDLAGVVFSPVDHDEALRISALTGAGCDGLLRRLDEALFQDGADADEPVLLSADLHRAVSDAVSAIDRAAALARDADPGAAELIAAELLEAATQLGRLAGTSDADALYDRIFSRFCIGK